MAYLVAEGFAIILGFIIAFLSPLVSPSIVVSAGVIATCLIISHVIVWGGFIILDGDMNIFD